MLAGGRRQLQSVRYPYHLPGAAIAASSALCIKGHGAAWPRSNSARRFQQTTIPLTTAGRTTRAMAGAPANFDINTVHRMRSGYDIPVLGYGVYQTPAKEAQNVVEHALSVGYRHVDSAAGYRNEEPCAAGLLASGLPRSSIFFTSKVPPGEISYDGAKKSVDETIKKIGALKYVDLYLLHAPFGGKANRLGAWKALVEAVEEGKVRSIGVSNFGVHHLDELEQFIKETDAKEGQGKGGILSANQVELHPWLPRKDIVDWCSSRGVLLEAYSPLVRNTRMDDPLLQSLAEKHKKTPAQILVRWSLQKGFVPLPKSVTASRIEENAKLYDFVLDQQDMKDLDMDSYEPCAWDPTTSKD